MRSDGVVGTCACCDEVINEDHMDWLFIREAGIHLHCECLDEYAKEHWRYQT